MMPRIVPLRNVRSPWTSATRSVCRRANWCSHFPLPWTKLPSLVSWKSFPPIDPPPSTLTRYKSIRRHSIKQMQAVIPNKSDAPIHPATTHFIPIWYGGDAGPDLVDVAQQADLTPAETARLHASVTYRVYMLGFSPGFPYLGTVPDRLAVPRLPTPRRQVAAGSVGIAGTQTGIYPQASPGGWHLIGRTPVRLFNLSRPQPFLLAPGDLVRFVSIDEEEFAKLSGNQA